MIDDAWPTSSALFILACVRGARAGARRPLPPRLSARRRYFSHSHSSLAPSLFFFVSSFFSLPWCMRPCVLDSRRMPGRHTPSEGPLALASAYQAARFSCSLPSLSLLSLSLFLSLSLSLSYSVILLLVSLLLSPFCFFLFSWST